ncbi:MAG TPA: hypothetical protein VGB63_06460 [Pedobacter sp.]|jgi:hypothetical protein
MNFENLKIVWQEFDIKLQSTQALSDRLIISMIKERSASRLSKVKRRFNFLSLYLAGWTFVGLCILIGNPFDYTQTIEFIPIWIYSLCMLLLSIAMINLSLNLHKTEINQNSLHCSINKVIGIISEYEKPAHLLRWALRLLIFSGTFLFPLSFLPRKIERLGIWGGIGDMLISILISAVLIFVAHKLGAFKHHQAEKFQEDLRELDELKSLSKEMQQQD